MHYSHYAKSSPLCLSFLSEIYIFIFQIRTEEACQNVRSDLPDKCPMTDTNLQACDNNDDDDDDKTW